MVVPAVARRGRESRQRYHRTRARHMGGEAGNQHHSHRHCVHARRQARYRDRVLNDKVLLKLTPNLDDAKAALVAVGALDTMAAADKHAIERALEAEISEWCAAWGERV
jgi:hypothetical protein